MNKISVKNVIILTDCIVALGAAIYLAVYTSNFDLSLLVL